MGPGIVLWAVVPLTVSFQSLRCAALVSSTDLMLQWLPQVLTYKRGLFSPQCVWVGQESVRSVGTDFPGLVLATRESLLLVKPAVPESPGMGGKSLPHGD